MIVNVLIKEYENGNSLLLAADIDYATIAVMLENEQKFKERGSKLRIGKIEVTNKRLNIE